MKILIDTDWFAAIQDLAPNKQKEVMNAILNYPNGSSDTNLWKKTILPNLEKGRIAYYNKIQNLKQNNPQKTNKKITDSDIGSVSVSDTDTTIREDISIENSNKGGVGEKEKGENKKPEKLSTDVIHMLGNSYKAVDAVIVAGRTESGKVYEGIQIKNKRLLQFVKKRFNKNIIQKASDWAIDHNQHGYTYNASKLLQLLCKFQRDYEPAINYGFVQAEYMSFEPTNESV